MAVGTHSAPDDSRDVRNYGRETGFLLTVRDDYVDRSNDELENLNLVRTQAQHDHRGLSTLSNRDRLEKRCTHVGPQKGFRLLEGYRNKISNDIHGQKRDLRRTLRETVQETPETPLSIEYEEDLKGLESRLEATHRSGRRHTVIQFSVW